MTSKILQIVLDVRPIAFITFQVHFLTKSNDLLYLCYVEKESAEAMVSNFNFEFRKNDPDNRLRVQAIIEKTVSEAKQNILRKSFSKHLANS